MSVGLRRVRWPIVVIVVAFVSYDDIAPARYKYIGNTLTTSTFRPHYGSESFATKPPDIIKEPDNKGWVVPKSEAMRKRMTSILMSPAPSLTFPTASLPSDPETIHHEGNNEAKLGTRHFYDSKLISNHHHRLRSTLPLRETSSTKKTPRNLESSSGGFLENGRWSSALSSRRTLLVLPPPFLAPQSQENHFCQKSVINLCHCL